MALQGKATPERGFANFMTGILEGVTRGTVIALEERKDQRAAEVQAVEMKAATLDQQIKQAQFDEYQAMENIRRLTAEAELKKLQATDPIELKKWNAEKAMYGAQAAKSRADREALELQQAEGLRDLTDLMNRLSGMGAAPSGGEEEGLLAPEGADTRDVPAVEPGETPGVSRETTPQFGMPKGVVPGGRQNVGAPTRAGAMRLEGTAPPSGPADFIRSILPPGITTPAEPRMIPIQQSEVKKAMASKDANAAIKRLMGVEGVPFGAALIKMKQDNPVEYSNQINKLIDDHMKQNPVPYKAFPDPTDRNVSLVRGMVISKLNDPMTRAIQNPIADIDALVSDSVADLSLEALFKDSPMNKIRSYLALDAAQNGDNQRYSGRLLNLAMSDTFGQAANQTRFADDQDYTLRQIVHALYTDEYSSSGQSLLGYDDPLTEGKLGLSGVQKHRLMALLTAYWEPMIQFNKSDFKSENKALWGPSGH